MCCFNRIYVNLGEPPSSDQTFFDKLPHRICHILYRNVRIDPVQVIQVCVVSLKAFQRSFQVRSHSFIDRPFSQYFICAKMQLCSKHHILSEFLYCFADNPLVMSFILRQKIGTIHLSCIEKCAAIMVCVPDSLHAVLFIRNLPIAMRKSHTSHTDFRYTEITDISFLHCAQSSLNSLTAFCIDLFQPFVARIFSRDFNRRKGKAGAWRDSMPVFYSCQPSLIFFSKKSSLSNSCCFSCTSVRIRKRQLLSSLSLVSLSPAAMILLISSSFSPVPVNRFTSL